MTEKVPVEVGEKEIEQPATSREWGLLQNIRDDQAHHLGKVITSSALEKKTALWREPTVKLQ